MIRLIGLRRALEEGWTVKRYPGRLIRMDESPEELHRIMVRGAVVVDQTEEHDEGRLYWLGLPPPDAHVDLRRLAHQAGMLGEQPETLRWRAPW